MNPQFGVTPCPAPSHPPTLCPAGVNKRKTVIRGISIVITKMFISKPVSLVFWEELVTFRFRSIPPATLFALWTATWAIG
jgi:hypothetical protein